MNNFFIDNFNISKINVCIYVKEGSGQRIHTNRASHGLVLQLSGSKMYKFDNNKSMVVNQGDVFYLPKFSNYEVIDLEPGNCIAVNFDLYDSKLTYNYFSLSPITYSKFEKDFYTLLNNWNLHNPGYLNICMATLYNLIHYIQYDATKKYVQPKTKRLIFDAVEYIQKNISDYSLTIQEISNYIGVSPEYFRKLFKDVYGISPRKYIIEARIKKAQELISSNEFSISEISQMCGYESESYFSKEFKRICSVVPTEYNK